MDSLKRHTWLLLLLICTPGFADGISEVNHWRQRNGLRPFREDPTLTAFAQRKAEYRARLRLHNGHQGPRWPADCTEGTGEAAASWGWLTCAMEDDAHEAGAGLAVDPTGERYMVLVVRRSRGPLLRRVRPLNTSFLTPFPVLVK